jgi:small subunit ribosomal protein S17
MATKQTTETSEAARGRRLSVVGEVVSDKMQKTISVLVYRQVRHKRYGKYLRKSSVFKAHDEKGVAKMGDTVEISESRPMSKTKRWSLVRVVSSTRGEGV